MCIYVTILEKENYVNNPLLLLLGKKKASEKYLRPTVYREPRDDELDVDSEFKVIFGRKPNLKGTKCYH